MPFNEDKHHFHYNDFVLLLYVRAGHSAKSQHQNYTHRTIFIIIMMYNGCFYKYIEIVYILLYIKARSHGVFENARECLRSLNYSWMVSDTILRRTRTFSDLITVLALTRSWPMDLIDFHLEPWQKSDRRGTFRPRTNKVN